MTPLGEPLGKFLREHLTKERNASLCTCETYAYAFQLLVCFAARTLKTEPSSLSLEHIDATMIVAFLEHLETERGNSVRTRNARLAAIKSFFRFVEYRVPCALEQARRVHAIPVKRCEETLIEHLTREQVQALLDVPDTRTWAGLRDRAMLYLAFAAGLRVSELVGLRLDQLTLQPQPQVHVLGKGRRERVLPLWKETAMVLREWITVRRNPTQPELFVNARGEAMTRSGFEYILAKHVKTAAIARPELTRKKISPHTLRRTCAMHILMATRDIRKVALWLGHARLQTTESYLRADPSEKLEALSALLPPSLARGHFRPPDKLLELLRPPR